MKKALKQGEAASPDKERPHTGKPGGATKSSNAGPEHRRASTPREAPLLPVERDQRGHRYGGIVVASATKRPVHTAAFTLARKRLAQIGRLLVHRYGPEKCLTDDAEIWLEAAMAQCLTIGKEWDGWKLGYERWAKNYTPALYRSSTDLQLMEMATQVERFLADYTAERVGSMLRVTMAEREKLELWQLAAADVVGEELVTWRRASNAARMRADRAARGATPREQSEARRQPWIAMGVSESTYRRRKREGRL